MVGSSRTESLLSNVGIVSQRKKTSHVQQRINSARRKTQNELINRIGAMKIQIQVHHYHQVNYLILKLNNFEYPKAVL